MHMSLHTFLYVGGGGYSNYAENVRCYRTKFGLPRDRRPEFVHLARRYLSMTNRSICELHVKNLTQENAVDLHRDGESLNTRDGRRGEKQKHESLQ